MPNEPSDASDVKGEETQNETAEIAIEFAREGSTQGKVFALLSDKQWHCRECEGKTIASRQYAGGGGIQGLQRGTRKRPGMKIESQKRACSNCGKTTLWDRWTGETQQSNAASGISARLQGRILSYYAHTDVIEQRVRPAHELIIDHHFPMERWGGFEPTQNADMTDAEIAAKFQLLKKDSAGNHNLLKSRACERCLVSGKRGEPFGIPFWYEGAEDWPDGVPARGPQAEQGCHGCGWYHFAKWREGLREILRPLNERRQKESAPKDLTE